MISFEIIPKILHFKVPAGTSRGVYTEHRVWYLHAIDGDCEGYGECAPLVNLSCDDMVPEEYERILKKMCSVTSETNKIPYEMLKDYPSMLFGLECAMKQLRNNDHHCLWKSDFFNGEAGIPINGLIWMGTKERMLEQIQTKIEAGFRCIKLKIAAINFNDELVLLKYIRQRFSAKEVELRVDANGGFSYEEAPKRLEQLAALDIHSIEQPIKAGQWFKMAQLCAKTSLPIALDEELIGQNSTIKRHSMLNIIKPQYIILKPTLHGGISGCREWIKLANSMNIKWWLTSALESNIGLNAIAQFCATLNPVIPQGLGTGQLFSDNVDSPLEIRKDCLWYNKEKIWQQI
jgi:o-succinylbenzoate synthase